ncbi:P-loop containing nucleoside triphosphate hydrolase protein [Neocallimastix californiae]|jgi:predicted kinase|uniref:p-loop containing nucleoside triphosphate hydrolase protein n=1 Tax=Neocallimastix californiae TaxID=1754190 RepID=A0A1Y2DIC5_9FUNG|nr:P-loop containing nucleoside triphosphate hydrolase protein [Neocallimastix californiae]|eukprot:ORY58977.1 P-loop containing nucleoside triphosphate hydrolase protein [Neocallimastix californiae]
MAEAKNNEKLFYILRGLPGSGKTTLAKSINSSHDNKGVILSSDDYFMVDGKYVYDPSKISEAHASNQQKCREKCQEGVSPIIIDNTNVRRWEAKVYVEMAQEFGYKIEIREPDTAWWKNGDVEQLAGKTLHGVPVDKIQGMLEKWENDFTVESILNSEPPSRNSHGFSRGGGRGNGRGFSRGSSRGNGRGFSRGGSGRGNGRGNGRDNGRGGFSGGDRGQDGSNRGNSDFRGRGNGRGGSFRGGNNFRGNNFRGNGNNFRGNSFRGNGFRGNPRGNNFRGRGNGRGNFNGENNNNEN